METRRPLSLFQIRLTATLAVGILQTAMVSAGGAPSSGNWSLTGSMSSTDGNGETSTLLRNGTVLVAEGLGVGDASVATSELYDPKAGSWSSVGNMSLRAQLTRQRCCITATCW